MLIYADQFLFDPVVLHDRKTNYHPASFNTFDKILYASLPFSFIISVYGFDGPKPADRYSPGR